MSECTGGLSNTLLVGERSWGIGMAFAYGTVPNTVSPPGPDLFKIYPSPIFPPPVVMSWPLHILGSVEKKSETGYPSYHIQSGFSSKHPEIFQFVSGDVSVSPVNETIDMNIYKALADRKK